MHQQFIHRLEAAGFHYKSPESPDIWSWLESHFTDPDPMGPRFGQVSSVRMMEMIARGEDVLIEALSEQMNGAGKPSRVTATIEMPYIVGTSGTLLRSEANIAHVLQLIENPGTTREHLVDILPSEADAIPSTHHLTVTGGLYGDGHTAGYYDLRPGKPTTGAMIYLATVGAIQSLAYDMQDRLEDINVVGRGAAEAMIARALRLTL